VIKKIRLLTLEQRKERKGKSARQTEP